MQRNARIAKLQGDVFHLLFSHMHGTQHSFLLILGHCSVLGSQKQTNKQKIICGYQGMNCFGVAKIGGEEPGGSQT